MNELAGQALAVLITALFLAGMIERIAEWLMPLLTWTIQGAVGFVRRLLGHPGAYVWEGPAKLLGISLFNGVFYLIFFNYDFVGPLIEEMTEASVVGWRGYLLSAILIAGGSNLLHQVFNQKPTMTVNGTDVRVNCP